MDGRRWNQLIRACNDGDKAESINPPLNAKEKEIFARMEKELAEMREKYGPQEAFGPVEVE